MADINVERQRSSAWLWVLGLVVLGLLMWGVVEWIDGDEVDEAAALPVDAATAPPALAPVPEATLAPTTVVVVDPVQVSEAMSAYTAHIESALPADAQHLYAAEGIARLATALGAIVGKEPGPDADVVARANAFYVIAATLAATPDSLRLHADWMHRAAVEAVELMARVAETRFPESVELKGEIEQARQGADAIEPEESLLGQTGEVRLFFRQAADALRIMAEQAGTGTPSA